MSLIKVSLRNLSAVFIALACMSLHAGGYTGSGYSDDQMPGGYGGEVEIIGGVVAPTRVLTTEGGRYEFIVIGDAGEAGEAQEIIERNHGAIVRRSELGALGQTSQIATFLSNRDREQARSEIAQTLRESDLAAHQVYRFAQTRSPRLYAPQLIGDARPGNCSLVRGVRIGMVDGPVNADHPALQAAGVHYETVATSHRVPNANHGTAVAALMVGADTEGGVAGFARGAELFAVSAFVSTDAGDEASVERIAVAINRLVEHRVEVINLSISGPENAALARAISAAARRGIVMIGATGNEQRPSVAWPAAAPEVIAVTAVDAARRRFRRANTGTQVEFAAPGVDVYTARARGAGYMTGTSFAAPIVTALAARHIASGARGVDGVRARLRASVEHLGEGQRNTEFGWGLVKSGGC